jgi:LAO/AO transport system kinase
MTVDSKASRTLHELSTPKPNVQKQNIDALLAGDRLALARAITQVENEAAGATELLRVLYPHTGRAHIIGITGAPGTGKSMLVTALAQSFRKADFTVGIVAVDPTSPFTGGALLGDRVRMRTLSGDPGIFVRSMATRGALGGLSKRTGDVVTLLDAAGFDRILVETVGVGQAEVEIARTAHSTVVVEAPGLGDEVQAIKAGILEIADLLVVNKADLPGVERTVKALELMLELRRGGVQAVRHHGQLSSAALPAATATDQWQVPLIKTIATTGESVDSLRQQIEEHRTWLHETSQWAVRERIRITHMIEQIIQTTLARRVAAQLTVDGLDEVIEAIYQRTADPYAAAERLLANL